MKTKKVLLPIACAALSLVSGCGGDTPVARVEIEPKEARLPFSQAQNVRLTWTPSAALEGEKPTVFVHLLDSEKKVARTFDHPFPQPWSEGKPVSYDLKLYQSALAPPLPAGKYQVTLGLYGKDNKRWALDGLGESDGPRRVSCPSSGSAGQQSQAALRLLAHLAAGGAGERPPGPGAPLGGRPGGRPPGRPARRRDPLDGRPRSRPWTCPTTSWCSTLALPLPR